MGGTREASMQLAPLLDASCTRPRFPLTLNQHSSVISAKEVQITFPRGSSSQIPICSSNNNIGTVLGSNAVKISVLFLLTEATY